MPLHLAFECIEHWNRIWKFQECEKLTIATATAAAAAATVSSTTTDHIKPVYKLWQQQWSISLYDDNDHLLHFLFSLSPPYLFSLLLFFVSVNSMGLNVGSVVICLKSVIVHIYMCVSNVLSPRHSPVLPVHIHNSNVVFLNGAKKRKRERETRRRICRISHSLLFYSHILTAVAIVATFVHVHNAAGYGCSWPVCAVCGAQLKMECTLWRPKTQSQSNWREPIHLVLFNHAHSRWSRQPWKKKTTNENRQIPILTWLC